MTTKIDFSTIDIDETFKKVYNSWDGKKEEDYTEEEKKEEIRKEFAMHDDIRKDVHDYMLTNAYKETYAELEKEAILTGEPMDPEKIYNNRRSGWFTGIEIEFNDEEKISLGIKGIVDEKKHIADIEKYMPTCEFIEGTDYIFFSVTRGNILVPTKEFTELYSDKLKMLRRNAISTYVTNTATKIPVHTLITFYDGKNLDSRGCGYCESVKNEFDEFVGGMTPYAECECHMGVHYGILSEDVSMDENRKWYIKSICGRYGYFNYDTGEFSLPTEAIEKGCTVSEVFMFEQEYINMKHLVN